MNEIFTEEEIIEISERIEHELEDELERLRKLKVRSGTDIKVLGQLFFECHGLLGSNLELFKEQERKKIIDFLDKFEDFDKFRNSIEIYSKKEYGEYWEGERVKDYVLKNTKDINNLITLFFRIFPED